MLASNFIQSDITVHLQSENGILGLVRPAAVIFVKPFRRESGNHHG
jgi:hypothetical protein